LNVNAARSVSFVVIPALASIPVTGTQQYTAIETFSDGTTQDRTVASTWTAVDLVPVSGTPVAAIGLNTGFANGVNPGTSTITAAYGVYTGIVGLANRTAILTVNTAISVSFVVTPKTASIPITGTQQFTAIETFSDATTIDRTAVSTWTAVDLVPVSTTPVASIGLNTGVAIGVNLGTSTITATYGVYTGSVGLANRQAILTVTDAISVSFVVTPKAASVVVGGKQPYMAIETFSDATTIDRTAASTWTAVDLSGTGVATILGTGVATGAAIGTSTITATYGAYTLAVGLANRTAILTVTAPTPGPAGDVDLGTAGTYGIMANQSIILSAPSSTHIYGDVGLLATDAFTGFTLTGLPANPQSIYVTGEITSDSYNPTNHAAMVIAFNDLNAAWFANNSTNNPAPATPLTSPLPASPPALLPAGGTFTAAGQDLTGMRLGPGIYASDTPTGTLALSTTYGPLVLDAGGNPDAVFIFQASDITTTTGSVILRNGAQAKNVYWVLTATATIGTSTVFQGNILAGLAATVGVGASVEGRVLSGAGLVGGILTINGGVITTP